MMRTQLVQLPLNMPRMPSSFDMYLSPCKVVGVMHGAALLLF